MDDKLRILPVRGRRPVFLGRDAGVEGVFFVSSGAGASHALVSPGASLQLVTPRAPAPR